MKSEGEKILKGIELSDEYIQMYINSHKHKDMRYKISYTYYYVLDCIFDKEYSLLDIGIGTGGGLQEMTKLKRLVGIDGSRKMLEQAEIMLKDCKFEKVFINKLYNEHFFINEKFDAIHLGVYGSYLPYDKKIINHTLGFLKNGGILTCCLRIPDNLYKKIGVLTKMILGFKPITQFEFIFERMLPKDCEILLKVHKFPFEQSAENSIVYFIKKR